MEIIIFGYVEVIGMSYDAVVPPIESESLRHLHTECWQPRFPSMGSSFRLRVCSAPLSEVLQ